MAIGEEKITGTKIAYGDWNDCVYTELHWACRLHTRQFYTFKQNANEIFFFLSRKKHSNNNDGKSMNILKMKSSLAGACFV